MFWDWTSVCRLHMVGSTRGSSLHSVPTAAKVMMSTSESELGRVHTSICDAARVFRAWNAASPSWNAGPELTWRDGAFVPTDAAITRTCVPVLYETHAVPLGAPLKGLEPLGHVVQAEVRFLQMNPASPSSNASFLAAFWNEVLFAFAHASPLLSITTSDPNHAKSHVSKVSIVARNGHHWIRVMPIRPDKLLSEFRVYDLKEDEKDGAVVNNSIVRLAEELRANAKHQESIEIVLTRIGFDTQAGPIDHALYWRVPETVRMQWRLAAIAAHLRLSNVHLTFGAHPLIPLEVPMPMPPERAPPSPTACINVDVSAMVAICSDLTHLGDDLLVSDHANRALLEQQVHERENPLLSELQTKLRGRTHLVTTSEAIDKFCSIVESIASPSEKERAKWLIGPRTTSLGGAWDTLFPAPVERVDTLRLIDDADDAPYMCQLEKALKRLEGRKRSKSLGQSPHTLHVVQMGIARRITTLLAHAYGVDELLEEAGPITERMSYAAFWVIRPRSFVSRSASSWPPPAPAQSPSSSSSDSVMASLEPNNPHPIWWRKLWIWMQGPRIPKHHTIRHYPWWPFDRIEAAWSKWTAPLSWKPPTSTVFVSLPEDDIELEPLSTRPRVRGSVAERWLGKIVNDWRRNWLHWTVLCSVCVAWLFAFAVLVDDTWFSAQVLSDDIWVTPQPLSCTSTFWERNANCGIDGKTCSPFANLTMRFQCPSGCEGTTLLNSRTIGNHDYNYVPLVVGGAEGTPYRSDSFICSAAQHAGVIGSRGGCGILRMVGTYTHFNGKNQHGIDSFPFDAVFPSSYVLEKANDAQHCTDERWRLYVLNVVFLAVVTFVVRPMPVFLFWVMTCVGFWHVNLVSELRDMPPPVGAAVGDFGPHLFVSFVIWHCVLKQVWRGFEHVPLEFGIFWQGLWWIGVLLDVVFSDVPLQRLTVHDISQQPGAVTSLVIIILVVVVLAINQVRVIRSVGVLPKYLVLYIIFGIFLGLCAAVPGEGLRLHHYVIALILLPACGFPTRISMLCCAILFGMYINGVARWGFDGVLQDERVIQGDATGSSSVPSFATNRTLVNGVVHWNPIPAQDRRVWSGFALLVNDVLRYEGPETSFNLTSLLKTFQMEGSNLIGQESIQNAVRTGVHYLRLAYSSSSERGDFTESATAWLNDTFIPPKPGRT